VGGPETGTNGRMKRRGVVKVVGRAPMRSHLSLQGVTAYQPHRQEENAGITCDTNEVPTTYRHLRYFFMRFQITVYNSINPFRSYIGPRPTVLFSSSDPMSEDVRHAFVAFVRLLSEPVRRFSSCSTDFSQQIAQVVYMFFSFKTVG
jgi:hypothetical protein